MAENQVELVKSKTDIVEVIGERVKLVRAGRNFKGLCPFHGEKTPSFFVSPEMQMYKCFGCGVAGDVIAFLEAFEGMTFPEALNSLAKKAGVTITRRYESGSDKQRERLLESLHLAQELYSYLLTQHEVGQKARAYLQERQIFKQTIEDFHLGYAPNQWRTLGDYLMRKKGYNQTEIIQAGLSIQGQGGNAYDRFRGRVMFPQLTQSGTTVGMAGRVLIADAKEAKYINSPETDLYHKGKILFGLYQARPAIKKAKRVVVVEGEFDVLSSVQAHVPETIAIKGSAFTQEQGLLIKRLTNRVILALDADTAGQEAIIRAIEVAEPMGLTLEVAVITGGKDPDEMARKNPALWRKLIDEPVSIYTYYIETACKRFKANTGTGQKEITKMVLPVLNRIENKVEQAFYLNQLAEKLNVSTRTVEEEMVKIVRGKPTQATGTNTETSGVMGRRERLERYVVGIGFHLGKKAADYWLSLQADWFKEGYLKRLIQVIKEMKPPGEMIFGEKLKLIPTELQPTVQELYAIDAEWFELEIESLNKLALKAVEDLRGIGKRSELLDLNKQMAKESEPLEIEKLRDKYRQVARLG